MRNFLILITGVLHSCGNTPLHFEMAPSPEVPIINIECLTLEGEMVYQEKLLVKAFKATEEYTYCTVTWDKTKL